MSVSTWMRCAVMLVIVAAALSGVKAQAPSNTAPTQDLPNPYDTIRNWGTLPAGRTWGSTAGIETDPDGRHIWALDRCGGNSCAGSNLDPVVKLDPSGRVVASFGAGMFIFPHGLHVDREGNVWVTDAQGPDGSDPSRNGKGHTVVKFSPQGRVLLTLGRAGVAGDPPAALNEPNDVITAPNGDIFVADGHSGQNSQTPVVARMTKYSRDGRFIKSWGRWGSGPSEFKTPHALEFDSRGRLFVADRGNARIQIFDQEGNFQEEWKQFSRISGLEIDRADTLYAIDSESDATRNVGWRKGVRIGSARDGRVNFFIPGHQTDAPEGAAGEGVAVDAAGNVYAAEVTVRGLTTYVRRAAAQ